jgi:hypothetical protein
MVCSLAPNPAASSKLDYRGFYPRYRMFRPRSSLPGADPFLKAASAIVELARRSAFDAGTAFSLKGLVIFFLSSRLWGSARPYDGTKYITAVLRAYRDEIFTVYGPQDVFEN